MRKYFAPVCAVLLLCGGLASAQDTPREIVQRAIKAHGGEDKLGRITCDKVKVQGVLHIGNDDVPFTAETFVQLPGQFKNTVNLTVNDSKIVLVQILNGEKAFVTKDGQPQKITDAMDREMRETIHLERAVRLVPLLTDKGFELTALDETKVNDQPVNAVKVAMKGHKDLRLYFDKQTNLLVKTEHMHDDPKEGKEVKQEEYYGTFKDLGGGFTRPTRVTAYRDGKKIMDAQLLEVKYLEKIPEAEFKP
jgi:hypothetical protein